jgi:hypothetical protein
MTFEDIHQQIAQHVRAAYALLPPSIAPYSVNSIVAARAHEHLIAAYEREDWDQVLVLLQLYRETNSFSEELLQEIETAAQYTQLYERLGIENALKQMSEEEIRIIGECLRASVDGPFFPDWEFSSIFGLEREEVAKVANKWPSVDPGNEVVGIAINNSMNWLLSYPHKKYDKWSNFISVSPQKSYEVYNRWRVLTGRNNNQGSGNGEFFYNLE